MFELVPFGYRNNSAYDPFAFFDEFERNFTDRRRALAEFRTDIREKEDEYVLVADLPGFKKENIKICVEGGLLTISAERKSENEENEKKKGYTHIERSYGKYSRSFDISGIESENIKASYVDGVLRVSMPKIEKKVEAPQNIEIE